MTVGPIVEAAIMRGVPIIPGDEADSAESPWVVLSLLGGQPVHGYAIESPAGWIPQIAQTKGGVWAESAQVPGRTPLALPDANVTEQITVLLTASTLTEYFERLSKLMAMRDGAHDFHTTDWQTDPVYLALREVGEVVTRYAMIYSMNVVHTQGFDTISGPEPSGVVEIEIEREPAWRIGVPPGANPKIWAFIQRDEDLVAADMSLIDTGDHLVEGTPENYSSFDGTFKAYPDYRQNWVDIAANLIPGDAEALTCIAFEIQYASDSPPRMDKMLIAHTAKPLEVPYRAELGISSPPDTVGRYITINGGDAFSLTGTAAKQSGVGLPSNGGTTAHAARTTTGTGTIIWNRHNTGLFQSIPSLNLINGRYDVYVRGTQSGGAAGNTTVKLTFGVAGAQQQIIPAVPTNGPVGAASTVTYLGSLELPPDVRQQQTMEGLGPSTQGRDWRITAEVVTTATNFDLFDLIFIPHDEGAIRVNVTQHAAANNDEFEEYVLDGTGYVNRCDSGRLGLRANVQDTPFNVEVLGSPITFKPNVSNRLYFFWDTRREEDYNGGTYPGALDGTVTAFINAVPRSYGPCYWRPS